MSTLSSEHSNYPMPQTRVEICVMTVIEKQLCVALGRREKYPGRGAWELPGGVIRTALDTDLESAARRVARERIGINVSDLRQLFARNTMALGPPSRDWALDIIYRALTRDITWTQHAAGRYDELKWTSVDTAIADTTLMFNQHKVVDFAVQRLRQEIETLELPFEYLPDRFTLPGLQKICEALMGAEN